MLAKFSPCECVTKNTTSAGPQPVVSLSSIWQVGVGLGLVCVAVLCGTGVALVVDGSTIGVRGVSHTGPEKVGGH